MQKQQYDMEKQQQEMALRMQAELQKLNPAGSMAPNGQPVVGLQIPSLVPPSFVPGGGASAQAPMMQGTVMQQQQQQQPSVVPPPGEVTYVYGPNGELVPKQQY